MCECIQVDRLSSNVEEWLAELPRYQQGILHQLLRSSNGDVTKAAGLWLSAQGADNTSPLGGTQRGSSYIDKFKAEFKKFVCGNSKYKTHRQEFAAIGTASNLSVATYVGNSIAPDIGVAPCLLVPAIALLLSVIAKCGVNAWCAD